MEEAGAMLYDLSQLPPAPIATLAAEVLTDVDKLRAIAREAADASRAPSTEKAYASDWRDFSAFASRVCRERMPADPCRPRGGSRHPPVLCVSHRQRRAFTLGNLTQALAPIGYDARGVRDRALLLVGFAAALRRSQLVA